MTQTGKPRALVVDDEPQMVGLVAYALETQGFEVIMAYDGPQALEKIESAQPDLVVLDVMLPTLDGFEVCRRVRETTTTPIMLLTARKEDEDIIQGLELGADDYMTKPFNPREVALRAQAIVRRSGWGKSQAVIVIGALQIDSANHRATLDGQLLHLTPNDFKLLVCLASNAGRVLSWQSLLKNGWDVEIWEGGKEMVKTAIYRLRQKIEVEPDSPRYILTVRGVGYTMPVWEV
jgi:DNA-binding response OmpR family regulator